MKITHIPTQSDLIDKTKPRIDSRNQNSRGTINYTL